MSKETNNGAGEMSGAFSDLLGLDIEFVHNNAYVTNVQIDSETEQKVRDIAEKLESGKVSITAGIVGIGRIMWRAASLEADEFEDGQRMLGDMGVLIEELGQLLFEIDRGSSNAQSVLRRTLENRLQEGGVQ